MARVTLNSDQYIPTQRDEVRKAIDVILDDFMEPLINYTIITEIKTLGYAANVPQKFIDAVKFKKTGKNIGNIINTWGDEKTPLARYFNYGTRMHWIEPKTAKALAWGGKAGNNATAIFFQGGQPHGTKFSKGHYISGVPRTEVMERGFGLGKKRLAEEAGKIILKELNYTG